VRTQLEIARVRRGAAERTRLLRDAEAARAAVESANDQLERALQAANDARAFAEAANRSKSEFLATMSHEIRTPINAMIGYTQLLAMGIGGPVTDTQAAQLARIEARGRHLGALIEDVLDLSRIEAGQLTIGRRVGDAAQSAEVALALVRPQATAKGISLSESCECHGRTTYLGDDQRVQQILANVMSNATKFTPAGGRVRVECGTTDRPPWTSRPRAATRGRTSSWRTRASVSRPSCSSASSSRSCRASRVTRARTAAQGWGSRSAGASRG
jgi:signal transduction histidine kinase